MMNKENAEGAITEPVIEKGILYISCGVPGSGKSTFLNNNIAKGERIISRDEIRFSMLKEGEDYFSHENDVFKEFVNQITESVNSGVNTYADATHLNKRSRAKLTDALIEAGCQPSHVYGIFFNVPIDICLERNEMRKDTKKYVPRGQIRRMWNSVERISNEFEGAWEVDENGRVSKIKG